MDTQKASPATDIARSREFRFRSPGRLQDGELRLRVHRLIPGNADTGRPPIYEFRMEHAETGERIGSLELRVTHAEEIVSCAGHLGYEVVEAWRGRGFAARAVRLVIPLAHAHGLAPLWATCAPDNVASRKTLERAGFVLSHEIQTPARMVGLAVDLPRRCLRYMSRPEEQAGTLA